MRRDVHQHAEAGHRRAFVNIYQRKLVVHGGPLYQLYVEKTR